jgi:hypothetical protein
MLLDLLSSMYKMYKMIELILLVLLHMLVGQDKAAISHGGLEIVQLFLCLLLSYSYCHMNDDIGLYHSCHWKFMTELMFHEG